MPIDIVADILKREGGFVNNPHDRGGATNFGVTAQTYRWWMKNPHADVRNLTESVAREILTALYLVGPRIVELPAGIIPFMADWAVHSGPQLAIQKLQKALEVTVDGNIGPETLAAAEAADPAKLLRLLIASRIRMIGRVVQKDPTQAVFLSNWLDRTMSFLI